MLYKAVNIAAHTRPNARKTSLSPGDLPTSNPLPLCFHILTNCFPRKSFPLITIRIARECGVSLRPFSSLATRRSSLPLCFHQLADSLSLFALFFRLPFFVFNNLRTLLPKHPGCGGGGFPSRPPLRELRALRVSESSFRPVSLRRLRRAGLLATFNCRLSRHNAKIHPIPL